MGWIQFGRGSVILGWTTDAPALGHVCGCVGVYVCAHLFRPALMSGWGGGVYDWLSCWEPALLNEPHGIQAQAASQQPCLSLFC